MVINIPDKHYQSIEVYNKLQIAAERIGNNNYKLQVVKWRKTHKNLKSFRFVVTDVHKEMIDTMQKLLNDDIGWQDAIQILYTYENMKERFE